LLLRSELIEKQLKILKQIEAFGRYTGYQYHFAAIHASQNNNEKAFRYLKEYLEIGSPNLPNTFIQFDIMLDNLHDDPEFQA